MTDTAISRRNFLRFGLPAGLGLVGSAALAGRQAEAPPMHPAGNQAHVMLAQAGGAYPGHAMPAVPGGAPRPAGAVDPTKMNPMKVLTAFDYGKVTKLPNGRTLREYELTAVDGHHAHPDDARRRADRGHGG